MELQRVLLSAQVSLLGNITDEVLAVTVSFNANSLLIRFVLGNSCTEELKETIFEILTEMVSHLPELNIAEQVDVCLDYKFSIRNELENLVFLRANVKVSVDV